MKLLKTKIIWLLYLKNNIIYTVFVWHFSICIFKNTYMLNRIHAIFLYTWLIFDRYLLLQVALYFIAFDEFRYMDLVAEFWFCCVPPGASLVSTQHTNIIECSLFSYTKELRSINWFLRINTKLQCLSEPLEFTKLLSLSSIFSFLLLQAY